MTTEREQQLRQEFLYARQNPGFGVDFATEERDFMLELIRGEKTPMEPVPCPVQPKTKLIDLVTPEQEKEMLVLLKLHVSYRDIGAKFGFSDSVVSHIAYRNGLKQRPARNKKKVSQ